MQTLLKILFWVGGTLGTLLSPLYRLREVLGEITGAIIQHGGDFGTLTASAKNDVARERFRELASNLESARNQVVWYSLWAFIRLVPCEASLKRIVKSLIGLSNCGTDQLSAQHAVRYIKEIKTRLNLRD